MFSITGTLFAQDQGRLDSSLYEPLKQADYECSYGGYTVQNKADIHLQVMYSVCAPLGCQNL